jgi:Ca-activated chloride channel family protein
MYMMFDEETLKAIADVTRAEYFHATTAGELMKVYQTLSSRLVLQKERTEITALLAAAAATILLASCALSLAWFNRAV